jgi:Guanylate-binding protein, N-terminal domain
LPDYHVDNDVLDITNSHEIVARSQGRQGEKINGGEEIEILASENRPRSMGKSAKKKQVSEYKLEKRGDILNRLNPEFKEEAIPLVVYSQVTRKFELNPEAQTLVRKIQGPIGVLAVAGMYRTGKSYMLNRVFLNLNNNKSKAEMEQMEHEIGFNVGPTINPCTKGLWMWGKPLLGYTEEGEKVNVIVIDTEGLGGLDEDNDHDMRIFSLALLLSSYFVYNSMGSIDENALNSLSFVTNMSKYIKTKLASTGQSES